MTGSLQRGPRRDDIEVYRSAYCRDAEIIFGVSCHTTENTKAVLEIEKGFWVKGNAEFFKANFAENGAAIMEPNGIIDKEKSVEMSSGWKPYDDVNMTDIYTQQIAPNVIAVSYHGEGVRKGDEKPFKGRMTSIYAKNGNDWQLSLTVHQELDIKKETKKS